MSIFNFLKMKTTQANSNQVKTKKVIHPPRVIRTETGGDNKTHGTSIPRRETYSSITGKGSEREIKSASDPGARKLDAILQAGQTSGTSVRSTRYQPRKPTWDIGVILSLIMNAILIGVVILLAVRLNSLQKSVGALLGGLYENFGRMDRSSISTTVQVHDAPIPLDFMLPIVEEETHVTLTQPVTMRNAHVTIDSGGISIDSTATVTLPTGTILPVSLRLEVPVQTTVLMDLQIPVQIALAGAGLSETPGGDMHSALLGLQDAIGPLYCLLQPSAVDFLEVQICDSEGNYLPRTPTR